MRSSALLYGACALGLGIFACVSDEPSSPAGAVSTSTSSGVPSSSTSSGANASSSSGSASSSGSSGADASSSSSSSSTGGPGTPSLYLFLTSDKFDGARGGIKAVDALCQAAGIKVRPGGTFKAWLGGAARPDMKDLLPAGRTWYASDGTTRLATTAQLLGGGLEKGLTLTEKVTSVSEQAQVWTNILASGKAGAVSCSEWTVNDGTTQGAVARAGISGTAWTEDGDNTSSCSGEGHFVCIEVP